jgi:RND family efflux transporter MFP subunit
VHRDAVTQAQRFRALYADSAAARAQLDAAETGLARAEAAVTTARAALRELETVDAYAQLRAPFAGVVTRRYVDPGAFVAPGSPVVQVEDHSRLRIRVAVAPHAAAPLRSGAAVEGTVERRAVEARIEGVVPATGALYRVNALVDNPRGELPSGGAATLRLPQGSRTAVMVPTAAVVREGDLTGVRMRTPAGSELRWVRLGEPVGKVVEVLSGLRSGDRVLVPAAEEAGG